MKIMSKSEASCAMSVDFNILSKFIKPFDGDRGKLTSFIRNCNNAFQLASREQDDLLFKFILAQLEGKAEAACSLKCFSNWQELKTFLKLTFGEVKHRDHLLLDLQTCKIRPNEDISQYSLRIETCLTKLQTDITHSTQIKSELEGRIANTEDLALHTFLLGIPSHISTIVRCRNPRSLNEAIDLAIQEEKLQNYVQISKTKETNPRCRACDKIGHTEKNCFLYRQRRPIHVLSPNKTQFQRRPHDQPSSSSSSFPNPQNHPVICRYCKNIGHDISVCRKRQFNNARKNNQPQQLVHNFTESYGDNDLNNFSQNSPGDDANYNHLN